MVLMLDSCRAPDKPGPPMCLLVHAALSCDPRALPAVGAAQRPCRRCNPLPSAARVWQEPGTPCRASQRLRMVS
jgi:hypothetical protein